MGEEKKWDLYKSKSKYFTRQNTAEKNNCEIFKKFTWWPSPQKSGINARHVYYQELRPFWISLKMLGMLPYSVNKKGNVISRFFSKEMLYCIIFQTLISYPVYKILFQRIKLILKVQNNFDDIMFTITMSCLMIPHTIIPFSHWIHRHDFVASCKAWKNFQKKYEMLTGCQLIFKVRWKLYIVLPCVIQYFFIVFCVHYFGMGYGHYVGILAHVYIITFFFIHTIIFVVQGCIIIFIAKDLKKKLKKVVETELYDEIPNWTQLWFSLSKLVYHLGNLFYKMYMHLMVMLFCVSTLATYRVIRSISIEGISWSLVNSFVCLHIGKLWLWIICECGERVTWEVGTKFKEELMKLKFLVRSLSGRQNLQELIDTISQFPPIVHLNGFTEINRKLLTTLLTTGATYLFVVFQFSMSSPHEASSSSTNSTEPYSTNSTEL